MQDMGIIEGSKEQAVPRIINDDNVYIHKDIESYEDEDGNTHYKYQEYIYSRNEYIDMLSAQNETLMEAVAELGILVSGVSSNA